MVKSVPKMVAAALRLGVGKAKVAKIFGKAAVSRAHGREDRANGRPPAISGRCETQLFNLVRKLQDKDDQGEVTAEAIYRSWKGKTCSLKTLRRWLSRNFNWARPSSTAKLTAGDVSEREDFFRRCACLGGDFWRIVVFIDGRSVGKVNIRRVRDEVVRSRVRGQYRPIVNGRAKKTPDLPKCHTRNRIPATARGGRCGCVTRGPRIPTPQTKRMRRA